MNLDEAQRSKVAEWIAQGLKLSEIQNRLATELGVRMTYMDVRLLVADLKLTPKDPEPPKPIEAGLSALAAGARSREAQPELPAEESGKVTVTVDKLARPGALVSGKVTFSDGQTAEWHLDQTGQLAFIPQKPGYRPPTADLQQFQMALDTELGRMGF